jgi:L-iditol 2-dehydrogenase
MKAAVYVGSGRVEVQEWPRPRIGPGELLLKVRGCGICGSDIAKLEPGKVTPPVVLGHEVVGEIIDVGAGPARFAKGQRVVVAHHVPCLTCHYCRRGSHSMCRAFKRSSLDPGGFAEMLRVPSPNSEHATFVLPDAVSDETASFTEPLACCLRAARRSGVQAGDVALVLGLGSIGCLMVHALRLAGADVIGADLLPERRRLARELGASAFDPVAELDDMLRGATQGRGADVVIMTAGGAGMLPWAAQRVRDGGAVHYFAGGGEAALPLALDALYHRELTITATYSSSPADLAEAFRLLVEGTVKVAGLITHRAKLTGVHDAMELMRRRGTLKAYVTPT